MANGCTMTSTLLTKDTSHRTVFPAWSADGGLGMPEMSGAGDFVMVPMPGTYRELPWSPGTAWMQCDIYFPDGTPVPFCTRRLCLDMRSAPWARAATTSWPVSRSSSIFSSSRTPSSRRNMRPNPPRHRRSPCSPTASSI